MIIQQSQLGPLKKIGEGGQGDIFEVAPAVATLVKYGQPVVVKKYHAHKPPPAGAADGLVERAKWARSCDRAAQAELFQAAAWPLAVVKAGSALWGIVMPDMRPRYAAAMTLPSKEVKQILVSLQHVLEDDAYVQRRFGVAFDTTTRARVAEAMARSLAVMHRHGIIASDLSQANVLVALRRPHQVTFIDCDSMVFRGGEALSVVETPDWIMTSQFNERATTRAADQYKLALAILRLFTRSQSVSSLDAVMPGAGSGSRKVRDHVPAELHVPLTKALTTKQRITASAWVPMLKAVHSPPAKPKSATTAKPGKATSTSTSAKRPRTAAPTRKTARTSGAMKPAATTSTAAAKPTGSPPKSPGSAMPNPATARRSPPGTRPPYASPPARLSGLVPSKPASPPSATSPAPLVRAKPVSPPAPRRSALDEFIDDWGEFFVPAGIALVVLLIIVLA